MRRIFKVAALVLGVFAASAVGFFAWVFGGKASIPDGTRVDAMQVVKDGYVSAYLLEVGEGKVVLVDAGNDPDAAAIVSALARRGLTPDSVAAVLLTHGDRDHARGARRFPKAAVMALAPDVALAEGRVGRGPLQSPSPTGVRVSRVLADGEALEIEGTRVEVFAVPGHTPGSVAILARGVLFLGDTADVWKDGTLEPGTSFFSSDPQQNRASLAALARRLEPRASDVKAIACSHSGVLVRGLAPLTLLAARLARQDAR